ncbi:MAG: thiol-disulfide oxidoreductase DCC family protein [Bdellovibrionia bacterium]
MEKAKVYFDGKCILCSREIQFYQRQQGSDAIEWVDISSELFDAKKEGLDPDEVQRVFHVRDEQGTLFLGVPGFVEIWKRLPALRRWVALSKLPGAQSVMNLGYALFIRARPYLPRRKDDCVDGHCKR